MKMCCISNNSILQSPHGKTYCCEGDGYEGDEGDDEGEGEGGGVGEGGGGGGGEGGLVHQVLRMSMTHVGVHSGHL